MGQIYDLRPSCFRRHDAYFVTIHGLIQVFNSFFADDFLGVEFYVEVGGGWGLDEVLVYHTVLIFSRIERLRDVISGPVRVLLRKDG